MKTLASRLPIILRLALVGVSLALVAPLAGCRHAPPPAPRLPAPEATTLPLPDAIPGAFAVRQKLTARSAHGGGSFEAVLKKSPGVLTLIGLTPFGSKAFLLEQKGHDVTFQKWIPQELPFAPTFVLQDVHRVFDAPLGAPLGDGERDGVVAGDVVHERWQQGRLVLRTFTLHDLASGPKPTVTITYEGRGPNELPAHVTLTHHAYGYALSVETLSL